MRRRRQLIPFVVESDGGVGALGPLLHIVCTGSAGVTLKAVVFNAWRRRAFLFLGEVHDRRHVIADDAHEPRNIEGFHTEVRCVQSASKCFSRSRRADSFAPPFIAHRTAPGFHGWRLRVRRVNAGQGSQQHLSRTAREGLEAVATECA